MATRWICNLLQAAWEGDVWDSQTSWGTIVAYFYTIYAYSARHTIGAISCCMQCVRGKEGDLCKGCKIRCNPGKRWSSYYTTHFRGEDVIIEPEVSCPISRRDIIKNYHWSFTNTTSRKIYDGTRIIGSTGCRENLWSSQYIVSNNGWKEMVSGCHILHWAMDLP